MPAGPFLAWLQERREHHDRTARDGAPVQALIGELGWDGGNKGSSGSGARRVGRFLSDDAPTMIGRALVEDTLHHATGTPWSFYAIYVDFAHELEHPIAVLGTRF